MMPLNFFLKDPFSCNSKSIPCFSSEQTQEVVLWGKHGESFDEETVLKKSLEGIVVAIFAGITATSQKFTGELSNERASRKNERIYFIYY